MKLDILKERETPLLSRKRVTAMAEHSGVTPSRNDLRAAFAKKYDTTPELTIIKHIYPRFGATKAKVIAHIYSDEKDKKLVENEYMLKKHKIEAPAPKEEAAPAAEVPKVEAPAEKKEAAPKEEAPAAEEKSE